MDFYLRNFGVPEAKSFLDELAPYLLTVGIALGIWSDHDVNSEGEDK
ncbi:hypothetical protein YBT1520_03980 [Bacillus thuringiensis serovar kurstaki str. YBT-1520]|nr:hypothetical protein YBT1520_03980 [Bacillus thuringiensis serovar kurstaki str. YBT-1520]